MLFTVPQDALIAFALGEGLALSASRRITPGARLWGAPFKEALLYLAVVFVPASYSFFHFWPDWSLVYMLDTSVAGRMLPWLAFGGVFSAGGLGFALAHALLLRGARRGVVVTAGLAFSGAVGWIAMFPERFWQVGTYDQFLVGEAPPLTEGPFLAHFAVATLITAFGFALFVVINRRRAKKDGAP